MRLRGLKGVEMRVTGVKVHSSGFGACGGWVVCYYGVTIVTSDAFILLGFG